MPLVTINMKKGHSKHYQKQFLDAVHAGLVEAIGISDEDRFQRIIEYEKDCFETAPDKTEDFCIIEIIMFPGRTTEQKKRIIAFITENLQARLGIRPEDVFIIIQDPGLENWGMRGRQLGEGTTRKGVEKT